MASNNSKKGRQARTDYLNSVLTNPQLQSILDAQGGATSKRDRRQNVGFSDKDLMSMQWDYSMKQEERAYNEEMYNKYQSPAAMMQQYQDAGLNAALMYTGGQAITPPAASSDAPTSGSVSTPETSAMDNIFGIISQIAAVAQAGSQINEAQASAEQARSQASLNKKQEDRIDYQNKLDDARTIAQKIENDWTPVLNSQKLENARSEVAKNSAEIHKLASDVKVNENTIEIGNARIQVLNEQAGLVNMHVYESYTKALLNNAQKLQTETVMTAQRDLYVANAQLAGAKYETEEQLRDSQELKNLMTSYQSYISALKDQDIIDSGLYSSLVDVNEQRVKNMKTEKVMSIVNGTVGNVCNIANTVANCIKPFGSATPVMSGSPWNMSNSVGADSVTFFD